MSFILKKYVQNSYMAFLLDMHSIFLFYFLLNQMDCLLQILRDELWPVKYIHKMVCI